jgi:AcrR family transcriptional regulator
MTHPPDAETPMNTPVRNRRKATQRERLLKGMVAAANRGGYAGANVSEVIAQAGVSRPTFYDYFSDRDACFLAAMADAHDRLLGEIRDAIAASAPEQALASALAATVAFAASDPAQARFLMKETLAGGPDALQERDRQIRASAKPVEAALRQVPAGAMIPDLPVAAVLGAVHRLLASRLRRGERAFGEFADDLRSWAESYGQVAGEQRWRKLAPRAAPKRPPHLAPATTLRAPARLGRGRPRLSEEEVAENHRQRIMFATAQVVQQRGYSTATVSEITRLASVDSRAFYRLFTDKQEAFSAIHELGFQYLMAATASAFFAGKSWPERVWEAFRAATQSIDDMPTLAHVAFVESYAVGVRGIQRVEDSRAAFTIFLQEGYRYQPAATPPSRVALEAIITTVFEIIYLQARASAKPETAGLLADMVHLALAPFMGTQATNGFIDERLRQSRRASSSGHGKVRQRTGERSK